MAPPPACSVPENRPSIPVSQDTVNKRTDPKLGPTLFTALPCIYLQMFASASRRALGSLIPPKIASPAAVSSGGTSVRTQSVIDFYSKLPKGPQPAAQKATGLRGKYFEGPNASGIGCGVAGEAEGLLATLSRLRCGHGMEGSIPGMAVKRMNDSQDCFAPILATIFILFGIGYTIDYNST
ncbi:hypothetical protein QFC22_004676 [Naganishia vaughanmartiniae]|uniref:Uncharacterized protein n=1 Tax=Naganishia vaughanmartiniae TaxID=1424756 RepID=A0ACC2WZX0_9TREE|nr:hypothetical protein QFC22_004676 [Naganishia vaughanmartiniae]